MFYDLFEFLILFILVLEIFTISFDLDIALSIRQVFFLFFISLLPVCLFHVFIPDYDYILSDLVLGIDVCLIFKKEIFKTFASYFFTCALIYQLEIGLFDLAVTIIDRLPVQNVDYVLVDYLVMAFLAIAYTLFYLISREHNDNTSGNQKKGIFRIFIVVEVIVLLLVFCFSREFSELSKQASEADWDIERMTSILSLVLALLGFLISYIISRNIHYRELIRTNNQLLLQQKIYFDKLIASEEATKKIRHDLKHHVTVLEQFLSTGEYKKAQDYLDVMYGKLSFYKPEYSCHHIILDSILSVYQKQFEDHGIHVSIKGAFPSDITINDFDLCVIFSNLLLNAIEACMKIEDKNNRKIFISISSYGLYVRILVKNTCIPLSRGLKTSKKDQTNHGIGLKSVKDSLKHNEGTMDISYDKDTFCVSVILQGRAV